MKDNSYEDMSVYYANQEMIDKEIAMSINTALIYDISMPKNVKIIKVSSDEFFVKAKNEIRDDMACFFGTAAIYRDIPGKGSKVGRLIWEN